MKKMLFTQFVIMIIASTSVMAEWELVDLGGATRVYVDKSTIRKKDNLLKMWIMTDFVSPQQFEEKPLLSVKMLYEFDCTDETNRVAFQVGYSEHMGKGNVVGSENNNAQFEPNVPESIGVKLSEIACRYVASKNTMSESDDIGAMDVLGGSISFLGDVLKAIPASFGGVFVAVKELDTMKGREFMIETMNDWRTDNLPQGQEKVRNWWENKLAFLGVPTEYIQDKLYNAGIPIRTAIPFSYLLNPINYILIFLFYIGALKLIRFFLQVQKN